VSGITLFLGDEDATVAFGAKLAEVTKGHGVIFLEGDLGAGKTTLSRGLIRGLGHTGPVKSPTFTVVEPYEIGDVRAFHFDLYRLNRPDEAFEIGLYEALDEGCALIEWPERLGEDPARFLGRDILTITLAEAGEGRTATVSGAGAWEARLENVHV